MNDNEAPAVRPVNPFAPPQAEVADVPFGGPTLSDPGRRLLAAIVDAIVQGGAFWLVSRFWPGPFASASGMLSLVALSLLLFLLIQGPLLVRRGQTVGKLLLGMRIVRRSDGGRVAPLRLLGLRYGVGFLMVLVGTAVTAIWNLVDSLLIFRQSRQCLHDQIAGTIVVDARS